MLYSQPRRLNDIFKKLLNHLVTSLLPSKPSKPRPPCFPIFLRIKASAHLMPCNIQHGLALFSLWLHHLLFCSHTQLGYTATLVFQSHSKHVTTLPPSYIFFALTGTLYLFYPCGSLPNLQSSLFLFKCYFFIFSIMYFSI